MVPLLDRFPLSGLPCSLVISRHHLLPQHRLVTDKSGQTADMMVERYKFFRWTPRTAWLSFAYMVAFPTFIGYLGFVTDVSSRSFNYMVDIERERLLKGSRHRESGR